ncbi:DUF4145 domain-containing protein [Klebsiella sp. CVUAS 11332]|uniref:DUF4145 domain-containing protein n=1 Tax=Klebsiella sp. CVUAS 11332 TaxID=2020690 RepID=UPI001BA3C473|nr:hypothetical protein [Klebsiella sp. CVUAS 11332]MBW6033704.1 hypothetical protein [Klebsiella sp. CVUAS 11332]HBC9241682.1 hypothetical protein [Klebsiella oxytoca]
MDWLTFFSKLIEHCTWPGVLLFIAIRYRKTIVALASSLNSIKVGDFVDANFSREAAKIATVSEVELPPSGVNFEQQEVENKLLELPPRLAILDAWKIVENSIDEFIVNKNVGSTAMSSGYPSKLPPIRKISELRRAEYITAHQAEMLDSLRKLRNEVVHGPYGLEPSQVDAINYVKSALAFSNLFKMNINLDNK